MKENCRFRDPHRLKISWPLCHYISMGTGGGRGSTFHEMRSANKHLTSCQENGRCKKSHIEAVDETLKEKQPRGHKRFHLGVLGWRPEGSAEHRIGPRAEAAEAKEASYFARTRSAASSGSGTPAEQDGCLRRATSIGICNAFRATSKVSFLSQFVSMHTC